MTVGELIGILQNMPLRNEIVVVVGEGHYLPVDCAVQDDFHEIVSILTKPE